jgi:FtsZ-interacting cell division protein ZipA
MEQTTLVIIVLLVLIFAAMWSRRRHVNQVIQQSLIFKNKSASAR